MSDTSSALEPRQNAAGGGEARVMMNEDIEIYPARRRDDLASPNVQVFEAKDRRQVGEHIAMLCGRAAVPRVTNVGSYRQIKNPSLLKLVDAAILNWSPEGRQRFAFIYERPPQRRLLQTLESVPYRLSESRILASLIQPILSVLEEFKNTDLVHGAINPQNIFFSGGEGAEVAMLGECLSSACSMRQHPLFEPLDRSMAQAAGRGPGTSRDDLYAFGVCVAMAATGKNLLLGKSSQQIVREKLAEGSYAVAIGQERMPAGVAEFLRGVLNDDESQRWDIDEASRWLEGRRLSPKQPHARLRAARPFVFKEEKFWDLRALAHSFSQNVPEAATVVEQSQFDLWIKRNFEDKALIKRIEGVWEKDKAAGRDKLMTSLCMALDPASPVSYKGVTLFPTGVGNALADTMAREEDVQVYGEIISQQLISTWINLRFEEVMDASALVMLFEKCRNFLAQKLPGYGIERVLYTLSRECACMSPLLKDYFVLTPGGMLAALEKLSGGGNRPATVLDRHMISFLSVREPKMIDPYLGHVTSANAGNRAIGTVRAFAAIQKRFQLGPLPNVTGWMASLSLSAIDRFHDHTLREEVRKQLDRAKDAGNLTALLELLDDDRVVREDAQRFAIARAEFQSLLRERVRVEGRLKKRRSLGRSAGRQVAMVLSSVLAFLCIVGYVVLYFFGSPR